MENASKALIMAGGILISLLVISLLVVFFNNLSEIQKEKSSSEYVVKASEFNKQFEAYSRDVYGSDLLSLANKVNDYNEREADAEGYTQIKVEVKVNIGKNGFDKNIFPNGTYTAKNIENKIDEIESKVKELGNKSISSTTNSKVSRKVSALATMRTSEIKELGFELTDKENGYISDYNRYKTLVQTIKSRVFKLEKFEYDKNNGRVTLMKYYIE